LRAARALEALLVATVVGWVLGAPRALGFNLYTEQVLVLVLGEAIALAFLKLPGAARAVRARLPGGDWLAAATALAVCGYVALR